MEYFYHLLDLSFMLLFTVFEPSLRHYQEEGFRRQVKHHVDNLFLVNAC